MTIPAKQRHQQVSTPPPHTKHYHSQTKEEHVQMSRKKKEEPPPAALSMATYPPKPHRGPLILHDDKHIESDEDDGSFSDDEQSIVCSCGRPLGKGWQCGVCRRECPYCARALSNDPGEFCDRCFSICSTHGPFPIVCNPHMVCPGCQ